MLQEIQPVSVGAATSIAELPRHAEWLIEGQRDLEIQDPCLQENLDAGNWEQKANEAKQILAGYTGRLGIHGPFFSLALNAMDPRIREVTNERLIQALNYGSLLGATHMVIHSPFLSMGNPFVNFGGALGTQKQIEMIVATLEPVIKVAEANGCILAIENILDTSAYALVQTAKTFDSETVRLSIDVGHAQLRAAHRGGTPPAQWIEETGPYVAHLHLQDTDGENDRHWAPGDGIISWYGIFDALSKLEHNPRKLIEVSPQNVQRGFRYLQERGLAN
jgi:sugar phosphate isomerase/epimerase